MKGRKWLLCLCLLIVLGLAWILVLRTASGTEELQEQQALRQQAQALAEKKLYVRAIEKYKAALAYTTGNEGKIQAELLHVYEQHGDTDAYISLVKQRISEGTADEDQIKCAAEYYLESGYTEDGLALLIDGMEQINSEALETLFRQYCYGYSLHTTSWDIILTTEDASVFPASDGKAWYFVDDTGKRVVEETYEAVTPFVDTDGQNLAVVKQDGEYRTIYENGDWYGRDETGVTDVIGISAGRILAQADDMYGYYDLDFNLLSQAYQYDAMTKNSCGVAAVKKGDKWGIITDSGEQVVGFELEDVAVNAIGCAFSGNVAMVKKDGSWQLIDTTGAKIGTATFANAKAPEAAGYIAVADESGKWGFINREGEMVIDCQYSDAKSFSNQLAAVCIADSWGYIDKKNELAIEAQFQAAEPFYNGKAIVQLGDYKSIIQLQFCDEVEQVYGGTGENE